MEAVVRNGKIVHINGCGRGGMFSSRNKHHPIPDQNIPTEWWDDNERFVADLVWPDDLVTSIELESASIDKQTGLSISKEVHQFCGMSEQLGILRDQIVRMLNGDMTASEGFTRLNSIAIAEIEKGQIEKEAL